MAIVNVRGVGLAQGRGGDAAGCVVAAEGRGAGTTPATAAARSSERRLARCWLHRG